MEVAQTNKVTREELSGALGRFWTFANVLSLSRILLVIPIFYLILHDGPMRWLLLLVGIAIITDWFDGRVARWSNTVSEWGKVLDPLADKFAAAAAVFALVLRGSLPWWFVILVVGRDLLIVLGGVRLVRNTGRIVMSLMPGKVAVNALAITVVAALLRADPPIMQFCVFVTSGMLLYSMLGYYTRYRRLMSGEIGEIDGVEDAPGANGAHNAAK
jgi:cardiolipin synthase (CMP-forming)